MTPIDRFERHLPDRLDDLAPASVPAYIDDILGQVARTRQRPAWTFLERWLPMALITARRSASPPMQSAWLLLILSLTVALAAATLIVGSSLLRGPDEDRFNGGLLVPILELEQTWDASTIPGLSLPSDMDIGPDGNLYVANAGANEILVLSPDGEVVRRWGELGSGPGQFFFQGDTQDPLHVFGGVAVTPDGQVYVHDTANDRVQQFDLDGTFVREWGGYGTEDGRFILGFAISDGPDGSIYTGDVGRVTIDRFAPNGAFLETIASGGSGPGSLSGSFGGIHVDDDGNVYVADGQENDVKSWDANGSPRSTLGQTGPPEAVLKNPADVAVDADGHVYVTEPARMVVYAPDGTLASTWPIPDAADPTDGFNGIAIAPDGTVYVSAWHRDVIFRLRTVPQARPDTIVAPPSTEPGEPSLAAASPSPEPSATPERLTVGEPFSVPFTALGPEGWKRTWVHFPGGVELAIEKPGGGLYGAVRVFVPVNAYVDACSSARGRMDPPVGPTVDDLVTAITSVPGFRVVRPISDITIDGHEGKTFDLESTLILGDCPDDGPWLPLWTYLSGASEVPAGPGSNFHQRIAVLDVEGTRVLIESWTFTDSPFEVIKQTEMVFESIDFE